MATKTTVTKTPARIVGIALAERLQAGRGDLARLDERFDVALAEVVEVGEISLALGRGVLDRGFHLGHFLGLRRRGLGGGLPRRGLARRGLRNGGLGRHDHTPRASLLQCTNRRLAAIVKYFLCSAQQTSWRR